MSSYTHIPENTQVIPVSPVLFHVTYDLHRSYEGLLLVRNGLSIPHVNNICALFSPSNIPKILYSEN